MPRRTVAVALAAGALAALPPATASALDLSVSNVEVTQGIQTPTNSILLVARRSTAVRATVRIATIPGETVPNNVTGRLHVFRNNVRITPVGGVAPVSSIPFAEPAAPDRNNETHTLNFELPAPTAITSTTNLDVRVDVTPVPGESSSANNSGRASNLRVENRRTPRVFFVRVRYAPNGRGFPSNDLIRRGVGDVFVRGILPIDDSDTRLYRPVPLFQDVTFDEDDNNDDLLNGNDGNELLADLATLRQLLVVTGIFGTGVPSDSFIYGWLAGAVPGNGLGQVGGRAAFGNTDPVRHQGSFAHELTHNFGFNHITQTLGQTGWDVGGRLLNNPTTNLVTRHVMPSTMNDVQVAGQTTANRWVSEQKYTSLLGNSAFGLRVPTYAAATPRLSTRVAVIHGIFDETGTRLIELRPVFRFPWRSQPTPTDAGGPFQAELRTTTGRTISVPFNAVVGDDEEPGEHTRKGFFEVMVPVSGELSRLRILSRDGVRTFGELRRSRPPRVQVQSFDPGDTLRGRPLARWTVADPDTPRSALRYQVVFSGDGGRTWVPVGANLRSLSTRFDTRRTFAQRGRGVFRVFVSDGLNTTFSDVRGLTLARG